MDAAGLLSSLLHDRSIVRELVELFDESGPQCAAQVEEALRRGDAGDLERAAHTLKGMLGSLRAGPATELAGELEAQGHAGQLAGTEELWARLRPELARVRAALQALAEAG